MLYEGLQWYGLVIAPPPQKIQTMFPFQYLGHQLPQSEVRLQKITLRVNQFRIINDFQQLLEDIN